MNFRFIYTFAKVDGIHSIKRMPAYMISTVVLPLSLLFIFTVVSDGALLYFAIIGGFVELLVTNALNTLAESAWFRMRNRFKDLVVATGTGPMSYMSGLILNEFFFALPGLAIYFAIGTYFSMFTPLTLFLMLIILLMLFIAISAIAFAVSFLPSKQRDIWGYTGILAVVLGLLPPVYYPYTYLPKPLLYAMLVAPTTSASMLIQSVFGLSPFYAPALAVFVVEVGICIAAAFFFTRWRDR